MDIRSFSWYKGEGGLSWSFAMGQLLKAFKNLNHNVYCVSTNGAAGNPFISNEDLTSAALKLQSFGAGKKEIDIDLTYTIFQNLPDRFLSNSKNKCVIYNYEYPYWNKDWKRFYHYATHFMPSSSFAAEIFLKNGVDPDKTFVIPHGVDSKTFNSSITPLKLKTEKKFKFVSVTAPHYRKNIDVMLDTFCKTFTNKDDVCLVLKTKIYKHSDGLHDPDKNPKGRMGFELCIGDVFSELHKKYGKNMPEIELVTGHLDNVGSLYTACDAHVSATGSECWFLPGLESMACGLVSIAPRYSGHLDFMNDSNSILYDVKIIPAKPQHQYWGIDKRNTISTPVVEELQKALINVHKNHKDLKNKFNDNMQNTVKEYSWENAADKIVKAVSGELKPYVKGTYKL